MTVICQHTFLALAQFDSAGSMGAVILGLMHKVLFADQKHSLGLCFI